MKRWCVIVNIAVTVILLPLTCFAYNYWVPAVTAAGSPNPGDSNTWKYAPWRPGELPLSYLAPAGCQGNDAYCLSVLPFLCPGSDFIPANLKSGYYYPTANYGHQFFCLNRPADRAPIKDVAVLNCPDGGWCGTDSDACWVTSRVYPGPYSTLLSPWTLLNNGYECITGDLNKDMGGEYVYVAIYREKATPDPVNRSQDALPYLTDLAIGVTNEAATTYPACPARWAPHSNPTQETLDWEGMIRSLHSDLKEGAWGDDYIIICYETEAERLGEEFLKALGLYGIAFDANAQYHKGLPYANVAMGTWFNDSTFLPVKAGQDFETSMVSWDPFHGNVFLSTGLGRDRGLGNTDMGTDGKKDSSSFEVSLKVPGSGPTSLNFITRFVTNESSRPGGARDDYARVCYNAGTDFDRCLDLGRAATAPALVNVSTPTMIPVMGGSTIRLKIEVFDDGDGLYDSGLYLSNFYFGDPDHPGDPRRISTALGSSANDVTAIETFTTPDGTVEFDGEAVSTGFRAGSVLVSTGRFQDLGLGSTDLGPNGVPDGLIDQSVLDIGFLVPKGANYLNFTYQFITSELNGVGGVRANDYGWGQCVDESGMPCCYGRICPGNQFEVSADRASWPIGPPTPVSFVLRLRGDAIHHRFGVTDMGDPLGDSALLISDVYFSKDPPSATVTSQMLSHALGHLSNDVGNVYLHIREDWLGGVDTNQSVSADPGSGSIVLSTGRAQDSGNGSTILGEGRTDYSWYGMRLAVPQGAQSLRLTADFVTSEDKTSTPGDSFIIYLDGKCLAYDANGRCVPVFNSTVNPSGTSMPIAIDLLNKKEVMLEFYIADESGDNWGDSAVIIRNLRFSPDPTPERALRILTDQMAEELDRGNGYVGEAWLYGTDPLSSAAVGSEEGSIVLSTGRASDLGAGNTVLGATGETDYTIFSLDLKIPAGAHTLSFKTNFITSEGKDGEGDVFAIYIDGEPLGVVNSNQIGAADELGLRNRQADWSFYVKCKQKVSVLFYITDEQNDRGGDSAVVISNLRFSSDPVPQVTAQSLTSALTDVDAQVVDSWLNGPDVSWSALAIPDKGQIVLSTGRAIDFGLGSSDLCGTSITDEDYTQFGMRLSVPNGMKSLGYKALLVTRGTGSEDHFTVMKNGGTGVDVVSTNGSETNRKVQRWMKVDGLSEVVVEFRIADGGGDGKGDFTVILSDVKFSKREAGLPGYDPDDGVPPDEQTPIPPENTTGDPVDIVTGAYLYNKELIRVPGVGIPFSFSIHYNSGYEWYGPIGNRWSHSFDWFIDRPGEDVVVVGRGDGGADYFVKQAGAWVPKFGGVFTSLTEKTGGGFTYSTKLQMSYEFDASGKLTSMSDAYGNSLSFIYAGGKLSKIVDTRGNTATLTYDGKGRLLSVFYDAGSLNQSVSFSHNEAGDLTGFTKVDGTATTFTYDTEGRLLTGTRADGVVFITNVYDEKSRVTEQWDAKGASRLYGYGDGTVTLTDRRGNKQTKTYDILGRLIQWDLELEGTTASQSFGYDENSNRTSTTDPLDRVTEASYDVSGNMTEHTDPQGNTMAMNREDPLGLPTTTDRAGNTFRFEYDPSSRTRTTTDPLGNKVVSAYNERGQVLSGTDRMGSTFTYAYTDRGDLASLTDPLGGVTRFEYDGLGRKISTTDPNGNKTTFTYDTAGRLLTRTNAAGQTTVYTYDVNGRMLTRKEAGGAITRFSYTLTNKTASVTDPMGHVFRYEYDGEDKMIKRIDPLGRETIFSYDQANRVVSVTDAKRGKIEATYNEAGERLKLTNPNGNVTTCEYDKLGRIVSENDPVGNAVKNTYEPRGLVSSVTNGRGQTIGYEYDGARRLTGIALPDATAVKHTYDANGNRVRTVGRDDLVIERQFDALNRLISRTDPFGNKIAYEYDKVGNLITLIYSDGKKVHYEYDGLNRMIRVTDWEGRITEYTYNPAGKLETAKLPDGSVVIYTFNLANRMTGMTDLSTKGKINFSTELTLDKAGNPIREKSELPLDPDKHIRYEKLIFQVNGANQLIDPVRNGFSYDADGNMTSGPLNGESTELAYDELNQLIQAGADTYRYDADGLRIEATINGRTVRYVQDPNAALSRVLEEQDEKGQIIARYIYGIGLIAREEMTEHKKFSGYGKLSIYHFDSRGNTIALTDEEGHITDRYAYDPYGRPLGHHGRSQNHEANPFTFCGQFGVMDDGNGLYFMRTRYYAPGLMRFVQRDVLYRGTMMSTQSANRYGYTEGNPVLRSDPDGQFFWAFVAIGIAVGVASQVVQGAITGDWGEWYDWVGAVVGGAIGGAAGGAGAYLAQGITSTVSLAFIGAVGGFVGGITSSAISQGFAAIGGEEFDLASMFISGAIGGVLGAFGGGGLNEVSKDIAKSGSFFGIKNFFQQTKSMLTDALQEELIATTLILPYAGIANATYTFTMPVVPISTDSLPVTDPSGNNNVPSNPSDGLKGNAN